jgi:hypothetical protein
MVALARGAAREEDGNLVYGDGEGDLTLTVARDLRHFRSLQMTGADREGQRVLLPL